MPRKNDKKEKCVVVIGPTASGKTALAIDLAEKFNGEIISVDSRQVYRGLDIGTNKVTLREMQGIPHHLIDVADPQEQCTSAQFKKLAEEAITKIVNGGKLPIVAGGTGFYIDALLGAVTLPEIPPNKKLREKLETRGTKELYAELKEKDPVRGETVDPHNKRRLIRALEIISVLGNVPKEREEESPYNTLKIGLAVPRGPLREKIRKRLDDDFKKGLVEEVQELHKNGVSWRRMDELGLQYRFVAQFLQGEMGEDKMRTQLETAIIQYAKRQMTYFKRDKDILWFSPDEYRSIEKRVQNFLSL